MESFERNKLQQSLGREYGALQKKLKRSAVPQARIEELSAEESSTK